jgi:hypothetical protein
LGPFETRLSEISKQKKSRVILALDTIKSREFDLEQARSFVQSVERYIVGVKLGLPAFCESVSRNKKADSKFPRATLYRGLEARRCSTHKSVGHTKAFKAWL